ncbi:hypothetical protein ACFV29_10745 [Streptomyces sp. NPDC059690]|uniref:hypothetical protein n=1 Tax=Streptomyces sp. NPDC059690 TaxID=3346907 RepID=UPI00369E2610
MIKRRTLALAVATTLLGGLGAYGAATAFASSSDTTPRPAASATVSSKSHSKNLDAMIQQCLKHLPANQRAAAEKQMRSMMSDQDSTSGHSMMHGMMHGASGTPMSGMMNGTSGTSMSGMMNGASTTSMNGMMSDTEGGS